MTRDDHHSVVAEWRGVVGRDPEVGPPHLERELWPVDATDGRRWFLKRLGPWRNLPVAAQASVLVHLARSAVPVAEFVRTDTGRISGGNDDDAFVLMPRLDAVELPTPLVHASEGRVGRAVAGLHVALARYPSAVESYTERISDSVLGDLLLPDDLRVAFRAHRQRIADALGTLPKQLVHGDLTPDNVLRDEDGAVSGFIDFDHLPSAPRIWDVAKYLSRRVRRRWRVDGARRSPSRTSGAEAFLDGYDSVAHLTAPEREVVDDAVLAFNVLEVDHGRSVTAGVLPRPMRSDHLAVLADAEEAVRWQLGLG